MPSFLQFFFLLSIFVFFNIICQEKGNTEETECNKNCGKNGGEISESYL